MENNSVVNNNSNRGGRLSKYPSGASALGLGIVGLGAAWDSFSPEIGWWIFLLTIIISICLFTPYVLKMIFCFPAFVADAQNTLNDSVITSVDMSLLTISIFVHRYNPEAGRLLWFFASIMHLVIWYTFTYYRIKLGNLLEFHFGWFVTYGGIVTVAVTAGPMGFNPWARAFWYIGLISTCILVPIITYRGARLRFEDKYKITIPVIAAPVNLLLAGYLSGVFEINQSLLNLVAIAAFTATFVAYLQSYRGAKLPFAPTFASFTFPLSIGATAAIRFGRFYPSFFFLGYITITITSIFVLYTMWRFYKFYVLGKAE